jgi:hypothetical protein
MVVPPMVDLDEQDWAVLRELEEQAAAAASAVTRVLPAVATPSPTLPRTQPSAVPSEVGAATPPATAGQMVVLPPRPRAEMSVEPSVSTAHVSAAVCQQAAPPTTSAERDADPPGSQVASRRHRLTGKQPPPLALALLGQAGQQKAIDKSALATEAVTELTALQTDAQRQHVHYTHVRTSKPGDRQPSSFTR